MPFSLIVLAMPLLGIPLSSLYNSHPPNRMVREGENCEAQKSTKFYPSTYWKTVFSDCRTTLPIAGGVPSGWKIAGTFFKLPKGVMFQHIHINGLLSFSAIKNWLITSVLVGTRHMFVWEYLFHSVVIRRVGRVPQIIQL
jgi:hypothetical protein